MAPISYIYCLQIDQVNGSGDQSFKWKKRSRENRQPCKKVLVLASSQVLSQAKTAITSWMLSVCFTSIASQSLLPCPWDIGHIFHSTVEDWHWVGKGSFEVENGGVRLSEEGGGSKKKEREIQHLRRKKRRKISCLQRISGWCLAWHWIESEDNLGPVTCVLMAQWIESPKTERDGKTEPVKCY